MTVPTVLAATYEFQPQISIEYDPLSKLYRGRMLVRGLAYDFEGPDTNSVSLQMDDALLQEYIMFERSIEQTRPVERGLALALSVGGGSDSRETEQRERSVIQEHHLPLGPLVKDGWKGLEFASTLHSLLTGNYLDLAVGILLGVALKKGKFVAFIGGRRVSANSKHKLRKEVQRMRNRMLQEIMSAIRLHNKSREVATTLSSRVSLKKQQARDNWEMRTTGGRPKTEDWRGRVLALRHSVEKSRNDAEIQWVGL